MLKALLSCCGGVLEIQQECCGSHSRTLSVVSVGVESVAHVLSARGIPQGLVAAVLPGLVDADVEDKPFLSLEPTESNTRTSALNHGTARFD